MLNACRNAKKIRGSKVTTATRKANPGGRGYHRGVGVEMIPLGGGGGTRDDVNARPHKL